ncbi:DNA-directed RNA polymerase III subunit rpc4 isoform X2 [Jatropha curcas]|nr:DNA-directed RNA polymerase III subunit rpc4 isoform X2 [Jatropha curcas]
MRARPKIEKKVNASQIAFGHGALSTNLKSYGVPKVGSASNQYQGSALNGGAYSSGLREKEYTEPWDYRSNYPVTLPLRLPYSGDPAILDIEEFGENSETANYDENSTNPAVDLGLMEENSEASMFFLQLPPTVPMVKRSALADGHGGKESSRPSGDPLSIEKSSKLEELPAGYMGKMVVYKSGAVKLKLGDTLYDVSPGQDCSFSQDVVAINTAEKHCCTVAEIRKHAIVIPDVDAIIKSIADL